MKKFRTDMFIFLVCAVLSVLFTSCWHNSEGSNEPEWVKESDWLFVYYYDADNNLNDELYTNMKQAEYALTRFRNEDGSVRTGMPSVNMVVLWDGQSEDGLVENGNVYAHPSSALFDLGADFDLEYKTCTSNKYGVGYVCYKNSGDSERPLGDSFKMSSSTVDYKKEVSWLKNEPDMGSGKTLTEYMKWISRHYAANHIVLCLSDHGAGTGKEMYADVTSSSRTLCYDDTNGGERCITTRNIKEALSAAGYTGENKISLLWMDVCLQSTAEIAYDLRGQADYMVASPNVSMSHEYAHLFSSFTSDTTVLDFGKTLVSAYHHDYYSISMPAEEDAYSSGCSLFTMSLLDLDESKHEALKSSIDLFADALLEIEDDGVSSQKFYSFYSDYVGQDKDDYEATKDRGIVYGGTYVYLSDIGELAKRAASYFSDNAALCSAAQKVLNELDASNNGVIVYSYAGKKGLEVCDMNMEAVDNALVLSDLQPSDLGWSEVTDGQLYMTDGKDYLTGDTVSTELSENYYGLTIETQNVTTKDDIRYYIILYIVTFKYPELELGDELSETQMKEIEDLSAELAALSDDDLLNRFSAEAIAAGAKPLEVYYYVENFKKLLKEADYVSSYSDYTGYSEKWGKVISLWQAGTQD
ncbi:clostripain-related cysteine peptidase [Treponema sp.]|uniref:clostripain-related cysteine peptidase n=1 Tax=Treponema sp. TaxID=166 RepID=UPI0025E88EC6|nr:clostripain-related cysteine peptidase [Treponema sp.]MCR5217395.1 hypothetical protein [Treponema sp.]